MLFKSYEHWIKKKIIVFDMDRKKLALSLLNIKVSSSSKIIGSKKSKNEFKLSI